MRRPWRRPVTALIVLAGSGCATPQSTRMTTDDFDFIAAEIAAKLRASDFLGQRAPGSEPIRIALWKVTNLSTDVIDEADQWWFMYQLYSAEPLDVLAREKNIRFVIRADRVEMIRQRAGPGRRIPGERSPTHIMTGEFQSSTRLVEQARTEVYLCAFSVEEIDSGEIVWEDFVEFKRAASGLLYD